MPSAEPRAAAEPTVAEASTEPSAETSEGGEEGEGGGEDWKPAYDANLANWRAEADEARVKAEQTRAKFEAEAAAAVKAAKDEAKAAEDAKKETEREVAQLAKLAVALGDAPVPVTLPLHKRAAAEDRDKRTREAWELVKPKHEDAASSPSAPPSTAWEELSAPHSSIEDISASPAAPTTGSGSYGSSGSGGSSSPEKAKPKAQEPKSEGKSKDAIPLPAGITPTPGAVSEAVGAAPQPDPANATPSLTLSIFTAPGGLTIKRVLAALGINLVLPFINGIMLGLGEITARECVRVGRLWWKGERAIAGIWRKDDGISGAGSGARSVAHVGLSGSGGF